MLLLQCLLICVEESLRYSMGDNTWTKGHCQTLICGGMYFLFHFLPQSSYNHCHHCISNLEMAYGTYKAITHLHVLKDGSGRSQ